MPLPPEVMERIPEEVRNEPTWQKFNDEGSFYKSYHEMEKRNGNAIQLPGKDAKPEDIEAWRGEQGQKLAPFGHAIVPASELPPESPDKYDIKWGENGKDLPVPKELDQAVRTFAKESGINNGTVQKFVDFYLNYMQADAAKSVMKPEAIENELMELLGNDYQTAAGHAQAGAEYLYSLNPQVKEAMENLKVVETLPDGSQRIYPYGRHPTTVGLLEMIGEVSQSDNGGRMGETAVNGQNKEQILEEAHDIMNNPDNPKNKLYKAGDKKTWAYVQSLFDKAHPGTIDL